MSFFDFFVANDFQIGYLNAQITKRKNMMTKENLEVIHSDIQIVYERMVDGLQGTCRITPDIARHLKDEAINIIRDIVIYKLFKAHRVPNIFFIALNISETKRLKKYLQKKYKHLDIDIAEDKLDAEVEELSKYFDCVISIAATESM